jgi:hypothetical protein
MFHSRPTTLRLDSPDDATFSQIEKFPFANPIEALSYHVFTAIRKMR